MDNPLFPTIPVLLERSGLNQSWGFRLQGGADFRLPLSIKKVRISSTSRTKDDVHAVLYWTQITTNSPSHNKLYPGDGLLFIDGQDVNNMKHEDAEAIIRNALRLQLILRRYVLLMCLWGNLQSQCSHLSQESVRTKIIGSSLWHSFISEGGGNQLAQYSILLITSLDL